jgi:hypothetical protein
MKFFKNTFIKSFANNGNLRTFLCEISSSHGGEYDVQNCLLGCTAFTRQYIPEDNSEHRTFLFEAEASANYTLLH